MYLTTMQLLSILLLGLKFAFLTGVTTAVPLNDGPLDTRSSSSYATDMFNTAIEWNDAFLDESAGYLIASSSGAGRYDTRHSAWYATQLLARNGPGDVARAVRIFDNVVSGQYLDPSKQWYGDYQQSPSEPEPGTLKYPNDGPYSSV